MNKAQLVDSMASMTGLTKADTERTLEAFVQSVTKSIQKNEEVKLVGFGTFSVSDRKERTGKNPQTGEEILIPALSKYQFSVLVKNLSLQLTKT